MYLFYFVFPVLSLTQSSIDMLHKRQGPYNAQCSILQPFDPAQLLQGQHYSTAQCFNANLTVLHNGAMPTLQSCTMVHFQPFTPSNVLMTTLQSCTMIQVQPYCIEYCFNVSCIYSLTPLILCFFLYYRIPINNY